MKTKQISTALGLMCLVTSFATAQTEWAPIGAKWHYSKLEGMAPPNVGYVTIESVKDSTINEVDVRVLEQKYYSSNGNVENWGKIYTCSKNDTIFCWSGQSFFVLYDFNAKIGEEWMVHNNGYNPCGTNSTAVVKVDSVGEMVVNTLPLKYLYVSPNDTSIWGFGGKRIIQRIGSLEYFLPVPTDCGAMDFFLYPSTLRCYHDDAIGIVNFSNAPCDTVVNYTSIIDQVKNKVIIHPIPTNDVLFIESPDLIISSIEIYNVSGKLCFFKNTSSNFEQLKLRYLPVGVYFIKLRFESIIDFNFSQRFIKN